MLFINKKRVDVERIMIDFIEYKNNEKVIFYIQKEVLKNNSWYYNIEDLDKMDLSRLKVRSGFATTIMHYLDTRKINYSLDNKDIKTYRELFKYLPAWLDFDTLWEIYDATTSNMTEARLKILSGIVVK